MMTMMGRNAGEGLMFLVVIQTVSRCRRTVAVTVYLGAIGCTAV